MDLIVFSGIGAYGEYFDSAGETKAMCYVSDFIYSNKQAILSSPVTVLALRCVWE